MEFCSLTLLFKCPGLSRWQDVRVCSTPLPPALPVSLSLPYQCFLNLKERWLLITTSHLGTYSSYRDQFGLSVLTVAHKKKCLSPRLQVALVYWYKHKYLWSNLTTWPFSKIAIKSFTYEPMRFPAMGFSPGKVQSMKFRCVEKAPNPIRYGYWMTVMPLLYQCAHLG